MSKTASLPKYLRVLIIVGIVLGVIGLIIGALCIKVSTFRKDFYAEIPQTVEPLNETGLQPLRAVGRGIYDKHGNRVALNGINFGNWFLQEGWMSVNSVGPLLDKNGNYVKINEDGIVEEYEETFHDEVMEMMYANPNLTAAQVDELWEVYHDEFIKEIDFAEVKRMGLNTIRLPMSYRNFMEGPDDQLVMRADAFERLDWFLEMCKKYELYAIIDMHAVVGGQSGYEHSSTRDIDFWKNEVYQQEMCLMWKEIARHYVEDRPDLFETIAAYDLVNEPVDRNTPSTTRAQAKVMDKMYQAIREVDTKHMISIEFCWFFNKFPNPERYGWENVLYQIHLFNWVHDFIPNDFFYWVQDLVHSFAPHEVPYLIGEFNLFGDEKEWIKWLDGYDQRGWNWTIWNYKVASVGWWDNSWGLYVYRMNLKNEQLKVDLRTATYDEIYNQWQKIGTDKGYYKLHDDGVMYKVLKYRLDRAQGK